ncbi:MAG: BamA/TamA family outer membrane protein [Bacteroidetes bacterium]|nr:BamA/TamA family outer membrane protein [Bacteroidota bacterium]
MMSRAAAVNGLLKPALVLVFLGFVLNVGAQDSYVIAGSVSISGNRITHPNIILRELKFQEGDTLKTALLPVILSHAKENIFNTRLFNFVTLDTTLDRLSNRMNLHIEVIERWYVWPIPYIRLSDQDLNAWLRTWDWSKLTYGIDFTFYNVRGRNETLKIITHFGFNQKYGFTYKIPYVNKKQTMGVSFGADMDLNHQVAVNTVNNQPNYFNSSDAYPKQLTYAFGDLLLRPNIYVVHTFRLAYSHYYFQDTVLHVPGFSMTYENNQDFANLWYQYKNDHRDVQFYPLHGWYFDLEFNHSMPFGFTHNTFIKSLFRKYFQMGDRWYYALSMLGKLSLESQQPYYLQQGLGYSREYVRGYEYYVVDGQHYLLFKNNVKFAILPERIEKINFIKTTKFNTIPLALYANVFVDMGYVYAYRQKAYGLDEVYIPFNSLQNTLMMGYGLGLDFTTYYDVVISLEGSMNLMGKPGIYIHFIAPI